MKQIVSICLLAIACCTISCKEDTGNPTAPVTEITHEAGPGEITFRWQQPADENYFYTDIQYTIDGEKYSQKVSAYKDSTTVTGIPTSDTITFDFYAVSVEGNYSGVTPYRASALTPPFNQVAESVNVASSLDGEELFNEVVLSWTNETGKKVTIEIGYINSAGQAATASITATQGVGQRLSIGNLAGGKGRSFTVVVKDSKQNTSEARVFTVDVLNTNYMNRSGWTFPGFDPTSRYGTIGYSSQALNESTATYPDNGSVLAMLDGAIDSFWHAAWSAPNSTYPHFFIIDFGQEAVLTHFEMARRQGNSGGHTGYQLLTCTEAGATDPTDPTTWSWQDQGDFPFNNTLNGLQKAKLPNRPRARYVQLYFDTRHKGTGNYVMVSEVGAYALDE